MSGYQSVTIVGNVGRDAESSFLPDGTTQLTKFSVGVSNEWTDRATGEKKGTTTWFNVTAWGALADIAAKYVKKGNQVMVIGEVSVRAYMGNDGTPKASLDLKVTRLVLLSNKGASGGGNQQPESDQPQQFDSPQEETGDIPF